MLSLFLYFLSVASKEEGITLPATILLTEFFLSSSSATHARIRSTLKTALPYMILGSLLGGGIYVMHPESGNISRGNVSSWNYFMTEWRAYLFYMRIWFWPQGLNADNVNTEFSWHVTDPLVLQALAANLLVVCIGWKTRRRIPALCFGLLWFYTSISPTSSVVVLAEAINEHRMYLPYAGFAFGTFTALLIGLESLFSMREVKKPMGWAFLFLLALLSLVTQTRNRVWANDENLWLDTIAKNPSSGRALNNLALVYMSRGEYDKANAYFEQCEKAWPNYAYCSLNRGISQQALAEKAVQEGRKDQARAMFQHARALFDRAYRLNPSDVHTRFHLAKLLELSGEYENAKTHYEAAIALTGGRYVEGELRLANCLFKLGRRSEAMNALERTRKLEPENKTLLFEIGKMEIENDETHAALNLYKILVHDLPNSSIAWYNYGVVLLKHNLGEARQAFEKSVHLDPRSEQGWYNLAFTAQQNGDLETAIRAFQRLVRLRPKNLDYQSRLQILQRLSAITQSNRF
jgi:tetratricopeptide (TPR) repeat protein